MDAQWELMASLEDLLKRQVRLYKGFEYLFLEIDNGASAQERVALRGIASQPGGSAAPGIGTDHGL